MPRPRFKAFFDSLDAIESQAVESALRGGDINRFASDNGAMPEVLAGGINEKAADIIGDNIFDYDGQKIIFYDEYLPEIEKYFI